MKRKQITLFQITLILALSVQVIISGCSSNASVLQAGTSGEKPLTICTSFYPVYIMVLNITKNVPGVKLVNIAPPQTGCLHNYQLTPADMKILENSQIFVVNGAGMETFLDKVIKNLPNLKIVEASKGISLLKNQEDNDEGKGYDHTAQNHEHQWPNHEHEVNPHVWVSISGVTEQVKNIGEQLARLDPEHAELYLKNTNNYIAELEALKSRMREELKGVKNRDIVTFHDAFYYFAREFNLNICAVIQGGGDGSQPSARELAKTIEVIKKYGVKAIFAEPQYPASAAETIARETGAGVYILDPAVTGPMEEDAYVKIMEKNFKILKEALM